MNKPQLKDHRQIGQELDFFSFHDVAPGAVFWHPKGWVIYQTLQEFIRQKTLEEGYKEISTPVMVKSALFKKSGHWIHFGKDNMFNLSVFDAEEIQEIYSLVGDKVKKEIPKSEVGPITVNIKYKNDDLDILVGSISWQGTNLILNNISLPVNYSLKPMNCPEAALIFGERPRSYQELPVKFSEFGILHRREPSGVLGGTFRVRQFMIDDAHLFVRRDQIKSEIHKLLLLVLELYKSLGFKPNLYLATKPDKAMGDKKTWNEAEKDLEEALKETKVSYKMKPKDGAFYGPKIDIHINDSQGRDWQLATIQLDFQIPQKMELNYIDEKGGKQMPIMIHRGIFGSFERFIAILTEHFQGGFPLWLSPVQVIIVPITDKQVSYAKKVFDEFKENGIRVELDERSETMQAKIRDATLQKVPYIAIIGDKEIKANSVSVRMREGKDLGSKKVSEFLKLLKEKIDKKI